MTERGRAAMARDARHFRVGASQLKWNGQSLTIQLDERTAPLPRSLRGTVRLHPQGLSRFTTALDAAGLHHWGPIAPTARIEVDFAEPALRWQGHGYLDSNEGAEPVEDGFVRWDWLRTPLADGRCAVVYDVLDSAGHERVIPAAFDRDGHVEGLALPLARQGLPRTRWWHVERRIQVDRTAALPPRVLRTLEDTPFYARSLVEMQLGEQRVRAMHESLDVRRLVNPVVQRMLPVRMPRRP